VDPIALLPIDITYSKLADWLVDRKKIPADWRKKVASLRARIAAALASLPLSSLDPWLQTCTADNTGYLEARRIRDLVVESNPDSRTFFGRLSGTAGEWDAIVRAYEKELLHLGEAAQIMVHYTDYEIPSQKKEIAKVQQQLTDMEKKESEIKRNAAAAATRYQQACQELGIKGNDVKAELKALGKSLPAVFMDVVEAVCIDKVGESIELYQAMITFAHSGAPAEGHILSTLQDLRDHPPSFAEQMDTVEDDGNDNSIEIEHGAIDWGVGASGSDTIDWGVGEENPGEVVDIDWGIDTVTDDSKLDSDINWDIGEVENENENGAEINWDIDLDETGADAADHTIDVTHEQENVTGVGRFLETEYRNMLLSDLVELKAFVKQRVEELERQDSAALKNQVQAMAPAACFQHGSEALLDMASHIASAIDLLTAQKTRDLCLLVTSSRFLDRLYLSLVSKKESETKLLASLSDLSQKRTELRNSLTLLWPKQESALKRTREVKEHVQGCISTLYEGRPVNVIGTINTVLGVA
jgi:hypothetical protein